MELAKVKIDSAKLERGDWVGDIPEMGDLRLKVRGLGSIAYRGVIARHIRMAPKSVKTRDGFVSPEHQDHITAEALYEVILLDWENLTENGVAIPYSREKARELLTDPDFRAFREAVMWAATVVAEDDKAAQEALLGNSEPRSSGNSTGKSTRKS